MRKRDRKFYKTQIVVTVLSEDEPYDFTSLQDLHVDITDGDYSGQVSELEPEELTGAQMARALEEQQSAPDFFRLDAEGNDLED